MPEIITKLKEGTCIAILSIQVNKKDFTIEMKKKLLTLLLYQG